MLENVRLLTRISSQCFTKVTFDLFLNSTEISFLKSKEKGVCWRSRRQGEKWTGNPPLCLKMASTKREKRPEDSQPWMFNNYLQERHGHFDNFFTAHSQPQCKQLNLSPYPEYLYKSHLPKISPGQRYCRRPPASLRAAVDSIDHRAWGLCQNTRHNYIRWREIQQMWKLMFLLYCGMFGTLKKYLALSRFLLFVLSIHT